MRATVTRGLVIGGLFAAACAIAGAQGLLAPNAPKDVPVAATAASAPELWDAIAPYVAQARASYPQAKGRWLAGLPRGERFFVTVPLTDSAGHCEQVFVVVQAIADGRIEGRITNDIALVQGYRNGQAITVPETALVDWLISKPDGSEEGNLVGKYLDAHGGG